MNRTNEPNDRSVSPDSALALGIALGAALGVVFGNIAIGVGIGVAIGLAGRAHAQRRQGAGTEE